MCCVRYSVPAGVAGGFSLDEGPLDPLTGTGAALSETETTCAQDYVSIEGEGAPQIRYKIALLEISCLRTFVEQSLQHNYTS